MTTTDLAWLMIWVTFWLYATIPGIKAEIDEDGFRATVCFVASIVGSVAIAHAVTRVVG